MYGCSEHCDVSVECPVDTYKGRDCTCYCKRPNSPIGAEPCTVQPTPTTTTPTTTTTQTTPTTTKKPKPCANKLENLVCKSLDALGFCRKNSKYHDFMSANCAKRCKVCTE